MSLDANHRSDVRKLRNYFSPERAVESGSGEAESVRPLEVFMGQMRLENGVECGVPEG